MLVSELITVLNDYPGDSIVILSSDGEGNDYSPVSDLSGALYEEGDSCRGDVYMDFTDEELEEEEMDKNEWLDRKTTMSKCVVLYPKN